MKIAVIGAGGHAKVVIATAQAVGETVAAVYDDDTERHGSTLLGVPVVGPVQDVVAEEYRVVIAVGDNAVRKRIAESLPEATWATLVHPNALVHASLSMGAGTVVFAGAVVQPGTRIGAHAIVNTAASVDHDCDLADYVHVAPGTHLAGGVRLGEGAFLGIGAVATPGVSVGAWTTVGAGAAVVTDLPSGVTAVGVPARPL